MQNLSKRPLTIPDDPFTCIFVDVIPNPAVPGLYVSTTFPFSLLVVEPRSKFKWFLGMIDATTETIIETLQQYRADIQNLTNTHELSYIRTDAGSQFLSTEFRDYCRQNQINLTCAASKHQEMNAYCESTWRNISTMARSMLVHADLSLHFFMKLNAMQ